MEQLIKKEFLTLVHLTEDISKVDLEWWLSVLAQLPLPGGTGISFLLVFMRSHLYCLCKKVSLYIKSSRETS